MILRLLTHKSYLNIIFLEFVLTKYDEKSYLDLNENISSIEPPIKLVIQLFYVLTISIKLMKAVLGGGFDGSC